MIVRAVTPIPFAELRAAHTLWWKVLLVALLVSELVTNCLKHAFKDGSQGHIAINFQTISDDGCGATAPSQGKGLGKTIINGLAAQQMQDEADKGVKTRSSGDSGYVAQIRKSPARPPTLLGGHCSADNPAGPRPGRQAAVKGRTKAAGDVARLRVTSLPDVLGPLFLRSNAEVMRN